jgi:hypothetical protein
MRIIYFFAKNKIFLFTLFIFYLSFHFFTGCQKSPASEPQNTDTTVIVPVPDTLAGYSLIPENDTTCVMAAKYGGTEIGRALTSDNFFEISVHVFKIGYWSYPPTTLDGITYSGSGNFTGTGGRSLKLNGTGIPIATGRFDFPLKVDGVNCFFREIVSPAGTIPPPDSSTALYYRAQIPYNIYYEEATATNGFIAGSSLNGTDDVSFTADISPDGPPYPASSTSFAITKGVMHNYLSSSNSQFKVFFSPGDYNYTTGPNYDPFSNGDGFTIEWKDSNGNMWSTYSGTGDQSGSTIKIVSVADAPDPINYYVRVKLQFNCNLYREDTGQMLQLNNGEFDGLFGKL